MRTLRKPGVLGKHDFYESDVFRHGDHGLSAIVGRQALATAEGKGENLSPGKTTIPYAVIPGRADAMTRNPVTMKAMFFNTGFTG